MMPLLASLALLTAPVVGGLVHLIIVGVVVALLCYLIFWLIGYLGVPEPIRKVVVVIIVVVAVLWLILTVLPMMGVGM
jgi:hypothetical protein